MARYSVKQGQRVVKWNGTARALEAQSKKVGNNARKARFYTCKYGDYSGLKHFTRSWKPYFPLPVIRKKWAQMKKQKGAKTSTTDWTKTMASIWD